MAVSLGFVQASEINSVKTGTCTINSGSSSVTCSLPSPILDMGKTFLVFQASSSNNKPESSNVRCYINNLNSITCSRKATTGTVDIRWYTAEFISGASVQHLKPTCAGKITNVPISLVDIDKTFLLFSMERGGGTQSGDDFKTIRLTSPTNVEISQSSGGCDNDKYSLQIVEFQDSSVTRGQTGPLQGANMGVTGLSPVDPSKSILIYSYRSKGSGSNLCEVMISGSIPSPTSLEFERGCFGTQIDNLVWERIEFTDTTKVQQLSTSLALGIGTSIQPINTIDIDTSLALAGGQWTAGQGIGKTSFSSDDIIGAAVATHTLTQNNLQLDRSYTEGISQWTSYVIDFGSQTNQTPTNQSPIANAGPDQTISDSNNDSFEIVTLDGSLSMDPDGIITNYEWREGANVLGTSQTITSTFSVGVHNITLKVIDNAGESGTDNVLITINPPTSIVFPGATWEVRTPEEVGLNSSVLDQFASSIGGQGVIIKDGYLVKSWGSQTTKFDWASAAKPVVSTLLFFAIEEGILSGVNDLIFNWGWALTPEDQTMTFHHLANMISGYSRGEAPGEAWAYNDYGIKLYKLTMERVFGTSLNDAALQRLSALDFQDGGLFGSRGGLGISTTPRDFARIGWFWLNKGNWDGVQLLPEHYFDNYRKPHVAGDLPRTTIIGSDYLGIGTDGGGSDQTAYGPGIYGYNWWFNSNVGVSNQTTWPDAPLDTFQANGHWNQEVMTVIPSLNMVVAAKGSWGSFIPGDNNSGMNQKLKLLVDAVLEEQRLDPIVSNPQPSGNLPSNTTEVNLSVSTNKDATCKFSAFPGIPYNNMNNTFSNTGNLVHSEPRTNLSNRTHNYYVKCSDLSGNQNTVDTVISFTILNPDLFPPTAPTNLNAIPISSNRIDLSWEASTDDIGILEYNIYRDGAFISGVPGTTHTDNNLVENTTYVYAVTAIDLSGKESNHSNNATATTPISNINNLLVASYSLDEGIGTIVNDNSNNGNNGTITGATWTMGKFDGALDFNGVDNFVSINNSQILDITGNQITLSSWVNPRNTGIAGGSRIISKRTDGGGSDVYSLYIDSGKFRFRLDGTDMISTSGFPLNQWTHVAATYDGVNKKIYINGVLDSSQAKTDNIDSSSRGVYLGHREAESRWFDGMIDNVRIYDTALTAQEIIEDMNTPIGNGTYSCGNNICEEIIGESCSTCPLDCGVCPVNNPPAIMIQTANIYGIAPFTPQFQSMVFDPENNTVSYFWDFGDNTNSTLTNPSHTYQNPGTYYVTLKVTDSGNLESQASLTVLVLPN
jgi:CubicO group peptidase (beta-lactamase class C family)